MAGNEFEAIVIGSGFGGAVAALRLAEAGVETCVIERGRRWERPGVVRPFPNLAGGDKRQAWRSRRHPIVPNTWRSKSAVYPGLLQRIRGQGIDVVCGAAWGGGSVVYGGMFVRPPRADFDRIFGAVLTGRQIAPYYDRVRNIIEPDHPSRLGDRILGTNHYKSAEVFDRHARRAGLGRYIEPVSTTVDWDTVLEEFSGKVPAACSIGEAIMGFNSGAMKSLDKNYLKLAAGARKPITTRLLTIVDAIEVEPRGPRQGWYRIRCTELYQDGNTKQRRTYHARHLFMAAGSMNTTRLMLAAKERGLPRLNTNVGRHWGSNGDYLILRRRIRESVSIEVGRGLMRFRQGCPTATSLYLPDERNPVRLMLAPGVDLADHRMFMLGMSIPTRLGRFVPSGRGYTVEWPTQGDRRGRRRLESIVDTINDANKGSRGTVVGRNRTFHPLGGMVLGKACDEIGRVKGYERLYVVDSSLFPGHTACCNPAWSVAAVAERCVAKIIEQQDLAKS